MTKTYLLEVIKATTPIKQQEMALLLASPLFNRGGNAKDLAKLYQIILDAAPDFSEDLLSKEKVYFQVFSDKSIVPRKLDKLISDLNKVLRTYTLAKRYLSESNEKQQLVDWANWLRESGLAERSKQLTTKLKTSENQEKAESLEQYRMNLLIAEEEHEWESVNNQAKGDLNIPEVISRLDMFFYSYRTELLNRYLLQQKVAQLPNLESGDANILLFQQKSDLLKISKRVNDLLNNDLPTIEEFHDLMQDLKAKEKNLSFQTLVQFYAYLRSSCSLLINGGHLDFIPTLHEIHKDNLERRYILVNGEITHSSYLNLVQIATRAKDYEWALKFTEDYKALIIGGDEDNFFYGFNIAQCHFAEGKFEEALDHLPDAPSSSHYHQMVRRLELKIYFELKSDLLLYKLDAFRKYIERTAHKTIAASYRTLNLNFLNILLQLSQSPPKDKARSALLVERIEEKKLLAERTWLLEKARALG
ncbi:MAG: hypothetical protein H7246_16140 [Phycisphaerae bacterium]|nr:hypothetical protein [Saprospiraceae bacterium]